MRIRRGPAAVTGDEPLISHCSDESGWEGETSRVIREPEDLPMALLLRGTAVIGKKKTGCIPESIDGLGFFYGTISARSTCS